MISDLFIRRPILATVSSLIVMLAGAIAIPSLPIARYPELTPPSVATHSVRVRSISSIRMLEYTRPVDRLKVWTIPSRQ